MQKVRKHAGFGHSFVKNPIFGGFCRFQKFICRVPQKKNLFTRVGIKKFDFCRLFYFL